MKILFTGGGTGGHLMPIIAVARELRRLAMGANLDLYYIGPKEKFDLVLLEQETIKVKTIVTGKIRRYFSFQNVADILFKIPFSFLQSFFLLLSIRPQLVFSKSGSGALPVTWCARVLGIPVFIHESDAVPGLSNRVAYKWAKKVFISFPKTEYFDLDKVLLVGNPVKKELAEGNNQSAKEVLALTFEKPVLLFMGGSQGADAINEFVLAILSDLVKEYEIIHVCGRKNYQKTQIEADVILESGLKPYYHLHASLNEVELKHAYFSASFIISRAGAGSIFEIALCGKPSILIPLPSSASDHQSKNAYQYSQSGAAIIIEQENLTRNFFIGKIQYLLSQPEKLEKMKEAALRFSKPLAAKAIAREIIEYLTHEKEN
ncbi:MAG: UDP-N-acetylglucosamine--N-acetylmuramyl-(pentapeptide) pyrophosphoryl-undecaprenol N-acetylglucosamine transferase [bacterium]|nr:UDP-N-acetylglucosamine--N-acetylmuramyl-(pentapeptide) pyrophosphoryl-undecaprenol N-acetylglucosamine transferase [bacterium]